MATDNCPKKTISSDITGLSYAIEKCLRELPDAPVWIPLEPNSIDTYGATVTTATRTPIGSGRQRIKGEVIDLEAAAGYTTDLTSNNHQDFMAGFLLAKQRTMPKMSNAETTQVSALTGDGMSFTAATVFTEGDIIMISGSAVEGANGVRTVASVASDNLSLTFVLPAGTTAFPADADFGTNRRGAVLLVGGVLPKGELSMTYNGTTKQYSLTSTEDAALFTRPGLMAGDWVYVNGLKGYQGYARLSSNGAKALVFDRVLGKVDTLATETDSTCEVFFSTSIRNPDKFEDMVFHSFQFEQTLGADEAGTQSHYVMGAMANEFTLTVPAADKVTAQFSFVACDAEARDGTEGLKAGTRQPLETYPMFNASKASNRVWLHTAGEAEPLFAYATNATVTINNNMTGVKAIGVEGNMDINVGTFEVGGSVTAYFQDTRAIKAIRANADVGGTVALVGNQVGVIFDMPKMGLSNGQTAIEVNQPVTIALDMAAVRNDLGYTMQYAYFAYLPKTTK
ncbi:major tail protein [Stenotrophomonas phage Siara]|uniref:Major tail protein n=1 Tax=Stenotrophomonas phage Siara TaxID=2859658 RepID=A0AAE7WMZ7_9CAUD|nr:major tail protein [Stenotrophomonas phage Siara]QYW02045.1 major tail protein [Stenotrophomonas phage Siara]